MSHSPPVPPGNQSPFPRAEPPHAALRQDDALVDAASTDADDRASARGYGSTALWAGAAAATAAIAAVIGIVLARSTSAPASKPGPEPKRAKRPRKKGA